MRSGLTNIIDAKAGTSQILKVMAGTTLIWQKILGAPPVDTSFETGLEGWTQEAINSWTHKSGTTPSSTTGPSGAYNGSFYFFTEASGATSTPHILQSPEWVISNDKKIMSFWYHMYGSTMGTLEIKVISGGVTSTLFTKSGNQTDNWYQGIVDLTSYIGATVRIQIVGTTGTNFYSDMCVDHVQFLSTIPQQLTISPTTSTVTSSAGSLIVNVTSNTSWVVTESLSWASVNVSSGSNNGNVTVSYVSNSGSQRSGNITIRSADSSIIRTLALTQSAAVTTYSHFLGTSNLDGEDSCIAPTSTYYTDSNFFGGSTKIWTNSAGTTNASPRYYSNGMDWLYWNGTTVTSQGFCGGGPV